MEPSLATTPQPPSSSSPEPLVTIVVVPRERFSYTRNSLDSIYQHTTMPFKLVYVDGNSPKKVQQYLQEQAQDKGFELVRTNYYLTPNQARNIGWARVKTPYLVFADNDVIVSPGWLEALVQCAEETNAAVVGPLMCQHEPIHEIIHFAGGESHIWVDKAGRRRLREKMYKQGKQVAEVREQLHRTVTELAEFHCVLVRRDLLDRLGPLDEAMMNTKEHLDFCMTVRERGETVYFEPNSLVTYVPGAPQDWSDVTFYMLRWSDAWTIASLDRLREKWNLSTDGYFKNRYKNVAWRRIMTLTSPLARRFTFGHEIKLLERALARIDKSINHYLTDRHAHQVRQSRSPLSSPSVPSLSSTKTT